MADAIVSPVKHADASRAPQSESGSSTTLSLSRRRSKTSDLRLLEDHPGFDKDLRKKTAFVFCCLAVLLQSVVIIVYAALDFRQIRDMEPGRYNYFRDVNIMIFFGFGFLMTFLRRYGLSAIGYTMIMSAMVVQLSIIWEFALVQQHSKPYVLQLDALFNGLFCAGSVMISFGAVLGKVTPAQLLLMALVESILFWVNIRASIVAVGAHDIGGGMTIHTFGACFGLAVCSWFSGPNTKEHPDNTASYTSDITSLAGTLFLWLCWPSFNAAAATTEAAQSLAVQNTFISLCACVVAFSIFSLLLNEPRSPSAFKFDAIHLQNATLAGGVAMGVCADWPMGLYAPIITGFLAGALSTIGYAAITPILEKEGFQDICGINNLHGMPGILGSLLAIIVASTVEGQSPGKQAAATFISMGIGIGGGFITGGVMRLIERLFGQLGDRRSDLFNDLLLWGTPSDYSMVVDEVEDGIDQRSHTAYVFCYGTSKTGFHNHRVFASIAEQANGKSVGAATTNCNLCLFGDLYGEPYCCFPPVHSLGESFAKGHRIRGELFEFPNGISRVVKKQLDDSENVPARYHRRCVPVTIEETGQVVEAYIYVVDGNRIPNVGVPGEFDLISEYTLQLHSDTYQLGHKRDPAFKTLWGGYHNEKAPSDSSHEM